MFKAVHFFPSQSLTCFSDYIAGISSLMANTLAAFYTSPNELLPSGMAPLVEVVRGESPECLRAWLI